MLASKAEEVTWMGIMDVYYAEYIKPDRSLAPHSEMVLPYGIDCRTEEGKAGMAAILKRDGFSCVNNNEGYTAILVNLELRRWASFQKACRHECVDSHVFPMDEFIERIYNPWRMLCANEKSSSVSADSLLLILKNAWNSLDAEDLAKRISPDFRYDSQWVFRSMPSWEYPGYIRGKFSAIRKAGSKVSAEIVPDPQSGGSMIRLCQDGGQESFLRIECRDGLICRMDMCMF